MFNPSSTLFATLFALPAILAQATTSTNGSTSATAPAGTANGSATSASTNATAQPTDTTAASSSTFVATNFTPTSATGTTCGSAQQNFNQCITKVGKDISSCTDNVCLCQTYANIATCYNGCPELTDQGKQYESQSTQYCTVAGVKPNTTATVTPNTTVSTPTKTSNTTPISNNSNTTNANTFSAAKGSGASALAVSSFGILSGLAAGLAAFCL